VSGPLRGQLADYLALRRALGYRMTRPEKLLAQFLDCLEARGERTVTVEAALDWARLPARAESNWWAYRLAAVRGFATYLHGLDPAHRDLHADRRGPIAARTAAAGHPRHADRAAGRDRHAGRGGDRPRRRRRRPRRWAADGPVRQVR
jgi:hypothetical protein